MEKADVERQICQRVQRIIGADRTVELNNTLDELGMDSLGRAMFFDALEDEFDLTIGYDSYLADLPDVSTLQMFSDAVCRDLGISSPLTA